MAGTAVVRCEVSAAPRQLIDLTSDWLEHRAYARTVKLQHNDCNELQVHVYGTIEHGTL